MAVDILQVRGPDGVIREEPRALFDPTGKPYIKRYRVCKDCFHLYPEGGGEQHLKVCSKQPMIPPLPKPRRKGRPLTPESAAKRLATIQAQPRIQCVHCGAIVNKISHSRWHGDKCKNRR